MQRRVISDLTRVITHDLPRTAGGVAVEAGWAAAHLVLYPFGVLPFSFVLSDRPAGPIRHDLGGLTPEQRGLFHHDLVAAGTPILLVHGIIDNHSIFTLLERALRRRGFRTVSSYDYGLLTRDIPSAAELLGEAIEKLVANSGYERIHVIGHSLGGLIARYFVQRLGGDAHVHTLVTLGTPHQGTQLARPLRAFPLVGQLTPQSSVIRELAEPAAGLPDPVRRLLQRHRPPHLAAAACPHRTSRPEGPEHRSPRRRAPVDAQQQPDRLHDRVSVART